MSEFLEKTDPELGKLLESYFNMPNRPNIYVMKDQIFMQRITFVKVGRNSSCICGSGRKYKKCCIDKG
jgi:uncharacterized protein YecA (UPF0149 family)